MPHIYLTSIDHVAVNVTGHCLVEIQEDAYRTTAPESVTVQRPGLGELEAGAICPPVV